MGGSSERPWNTIGAISEQHEKAVSDCGWPWLGMVAEIVIAALCSFAVWSCAVVGKTQQC